VEQAIRDAGLEETRRFQLSAPAIIMGSGGPSTRTIVESADITRSKGPKRVRTVRGPESDVVDSLRDARDLVQDQGRQLFDLLGLRDFQPLHRNAYETIQVGKQDTIFAGGCEELD